VWPPLGRLPGGKRAGGFGVRTGGGVADGGEKSPSAGGNFGQGGGGAPGLQAQLARLADVAAARLRTRQLVAGCIGVKIRRDDFTTCTRQRAVAPPTCELRAIAGVAAQLLGRWLAGNPGAKLRLLGVILTELTPASQLGLF